MKKFASISVCVCIGISGCVSINRGLEPLSPSYGPTWSAKVDTLTPKLEWEPYANASGKDNLRYQLQIIDGNVVRMFRDDIRETYYMVDSPLEPHKTYQWRVRPVWTVNGQTQGDQWNYKRYFFVTPVLFGWGNRNYNFTTPE
jgi:hypothetical protein